jgi:adenylyl-sulfate kinase
MDKVTRIGATNVVWQAHRVSKEARAKRAGQKPCVLWFTGLSGSGKSTLANALEQALFEEGKQTYVLDGDNVRHGLNRDLGFTDEDREENIRRIGEVAKLFVHAGMIVLTAFISPFRSDRRMVRALLEDNEFIEIFVRASLEVCERRDPKGLYKRARAGEIPNFTGIDSSYEAPVKPEIIIDTAETGPEDCVALLVDTLRRRGIV